MSASLRPDDPPRPVGINQTGRPATILTPAGDYLAASLGAVIRNYRADALNLEAEADGRVECSNLLMDHIRAESLRDKAKNLHRLADAQELELRSPVKVELVPLSSLRPCPENDGLYGAQSIEDPDIVSLINSIRDIGVT